MAKTAPLWLRWCRTGHRWFGVVAGLYFLAMALSGILLNHPHPIGGLGVPRAWLPGDYEFRNWNRNALRGSVVAPDGTRYRYGEAGVWREASPSQFVPAGTGLPTAAYYRDTRALRPVSATRPYLLAGTRGGLYALPEAGAQWLPVALEDTDAREPEVVDVLQAGERIVVLTRSRIYASAPTWPPRFEDVTPPREGGAVARLPLFRFIFHAHSGEVWGLPGRLAVDALGVALALFCVTGLLFWWGRKRRTLARGRGGATVRRGLRYHVRWGLWLAVPLLLVTLAGFFQRPPFLIAVLGQTYPAGWHPAPRNPNPWHDLLRKAAFDRERNQVILATADGFFRGPADFSGAFVRLRSEPPVSVMGATVFSPRSDGLFWVGSMSGLYLWDPASGWVLDTATGRPPTPQARGPVGDLAVAGLLRKPGGPPVVVDYFRGILDGREHPASADQPEDLRDGGRISLWHVLFEFHNGRLFGFLLGWWTWVLVPLGGLALSGVIVSGAASALARRRRRAGR